MSQTTSNTTTEPRQISIRCEVRGEDEPPHVLAVDMERGDVVFDGPLDGFRYFARVLEAPKGHKT